jgi:hypothetical protein
MNRILPAIALSLVLILASCASLDTVLKTVGTSAPLTEEEVSKGLREALVIGARNAAGALSATDGYFGDRAVKILLPDEAKVIVDNLSKIPGGDELVQDAILSINRAAEDAAREATPVFVSSITDMTLRDAFGILGGEQDAATQYLHRTTYDQLYRLYSPKIKDSVTKPLVVNISTQDSWDALTGQWNRFATSLAGRLAGFQPVEIDLSSYLTHKALEGMFVKMAEEELKMRTEINARVTPLLRRVFGSADKRF